MLKKSAKLSLILTACVMAVQSFTAPLSIEQQGSFAVGGTVKTSSGTYQPLPEIAKGKTGNNFMDVFNASAQAGGQTLHGDHATVFHYAYWAVRWCVYSHPFLRNRLPQTAV